MTLSLLPLQCQAGTLGGPTACLQGDKVAKRWQGQLASGASGSPPTGTCLRSIPLSFPFTALFISLAVMGGALSGALLVSEKLCGSCGGPEREPRGRTG